MTTPTGHLASGTFGELRTPATEAGAGVEAILYTRKQDTFLAALPAQLIRRRDVRNFGLEVAARYKSPSLALFA